MMSDTAINGPVISHLKSPSPPRWRFVNEAKKSNGYSSASAGRVVHGLTSEELAARYSPPDEESDATESENKFKAAAYRIIGNAMTEICAISPSDSEMEVTGIATQPTETSEDADPDIFVDVPLDETESGEVVMTVAKDSIDIGSNNKGYNEKSYPVVLLIAATISIVLLIGISFRKSRSATEPTELAFSDGLLANKTSIPSESPSLFSLFPSNIPSGLLSNNAPSSLGPFPRGPSSIPSTFPTYAFSSEPSTTPSSEPSATLATKLPSSSPLVVPQIASFTFQGIGFCIDALGYRYDSYYNFGSHESCGSLCIKNDAFRGIVIEDDTRCRCLYEDELLIIVSGMYDGYGVTIGGVGEITAADGSPNARCYKFVGEV